MTERQEEILDFIRAYQADHGVPPSTREVQRQFRFGSQTTVVRHLKGLATQGLVEQLANGSWGVKAREVQMHLFPLPLYGTIPAGRPSLQEQEPLEHLLFDPRLFPGARPERLWALAVSGDSMTGAHILDGDIAVLETRPARAGDIVAALVDDTHSTLKRLLHRQGQPILHAENPRYPDIVPERRLEIQGVLVGLIRRSPQP